MCFVGLPLHWLASMQYIFSRARHSDLHAKSKNKYDMLELW